MKIFSVILLLFSAAALAEEIVKIEGFGRIANQARGSLKCEGGEMEYRLPDEDILAIAFVNQSAIGNATVESVRIGLTNVNECYASRYPKNNLQNSFAVVLPFTKCNFTTAINVAEKIVTYSAEALITIKISAFRKRRFTMSLHCTGPLDGQTSTNTQFFPFQGAMDPITEAFGLTFDAVSSQELRPSFGFLATETNVHVIKIELDKKLQSTYSILGNRCWATSTPNPEDEIRYDFLTPQSCSEEGYVIQRREGTHKVIYEIADFEFPEPTDKIYFHCQLNVCVKHAEDGSRCEVCPNPVMKKWFLPRSKSSTGFQLSTEAKKRHPSVRPQVEINTNGKVKRPNVKLHIL